MSDNTLTMTVEGVDALRYAFDQAPMLVKEKMGGALMESAKSVSAKAKAGAPFRLGQLRDSIQVDGPAYSLNNIQAFVGTNVKYAPYQEDGTGIYGPNGTPIVPKSAPFLQFQLPDGSWRRAKSIKGAPAKHFMRNAAESSAGEFNDTMLSALADVVSALATL